MAGGVGGAGTRSRGVFGALVTFLLLAGVSHTALAQTVPPDAARTSEETDPDKKQEDGAAPASTPSSSGQLLDEISIYAERGPTLVLDVPATVTIINRKEIEDRMVRDIDDLVRYQPGISVERQTSRADPYSNLSGFTIRGVSGNRVMIMVDGTRIQERIVDGTRDFIDIENMKRVEIIRGPASVLWGSDALAGVIAFTTKDPEDYLQGGKTFGGQASTSYDTYDGSWIKSVTVAGQQGPWQAMLSYANRTGHEPILTKARADGGIWGCPRTPEAIRCNQLDPLSVNANNLLGKLVFQPSTDHYFKLTSELFDRVTNVDIKYNLGAASGGFTNLSDKRDQHLTRYRLTLLHDWTVGASWLDSVRTQLTYTPQTRELTGDRYRIRPDGDRDHNDYLLKYNETFWEGDWQFKSHFDLGGTSHRLTYGYYGNFTTTDYERQDILTNLGTGAVATTRAGGFNFANADTIRSDGYLQDEIKLFNDRLTLIPGVRYSYYKISPRPDSNYVVVPGLEPEDISAGALTKKIGATYKLNEHYLVYANYSEGFKMPTAQQLYTSLVGTTFVLTPNPDLRPETVNAYEAGVRGRFSQGYFAFAAFYNDYNDFIESFYNVPGTNIYTYRNLTKLKIWGFELYGQWQFNSSFSGSLSVSYVHGNQIADVGEPELPYNGAPPLTVVTGLKYTNAGLGLTGEIVGTFANAVTRSNAPNDFRPGGYAVFDTYWAWQPQQVKNLTFKFAVLNMFDARYFRWPTSTTYSLNPLDSVKISNPLELQTQPGRTFKLGANMTF